MGGILMRVLAKLMAGACLAAAPAMAVAETLSVEGVYPAGNDEAAAMASIAIETIGGTDGGELSVMIADRLREAYVQGQPWVRVFAGSIGSDADAAINGFVTTNVRMDEDTPKTVSTCVRRDADRDCIERREEQVPCDRVTVRVSPSLRMVDRRGRLILSDNSDVSRQARQCADEQSRSLDPMIREGLNEIADRMRSEIVPRESRSAFRVLESRKGIEGDARGAFREAIRLTKRDEAAACDSFAALESTIGDQRSLLFNIGLCAEAVGDFGLAENYYERTLLLDSGTTYARDGLRRIAARRRAEDQLAFRFND